MLLGNKIGPHSFWLIRMQQKENLPNAIFISSFVWLDCGYFGVIIISLLSLWLRGMIRARHVQNRDFFKVGITT